MATKMSKSQIQRAAKEGGDNELLASKGPMKGKSYPPKPGAKQLPQGLKKTAKTK
jgi:hypothetical protein